MQPIVVFKNKLLDGAYFLFFLACETKRGRERERERDSMRGSKVFCIEENKS